MLLHVSSYYYVSAYYYMCTCFRDTTIGDGFVDWAEFRLAWTFATGATRVELKQLEGLPLAMYCDAIFRELLFHWQLTNRYWPKDPEEDRASDSPPGSLRPLTLVA
jgi:hypothetical protein